MRRLWFGLKQVVDESWVKEATITTGFKLEANTSFLCESPSFIYYIICFVPIIITMATKCC